MARTMSATEARVHFGELLRRVAEHGERVVVERGGKPLVAVVPLADYERLPEEQTELGAWLERVDRLREEIRAQMGDLPPLDADELIDGGRDEWVDEFIADMRRRQSGGTPR